MFDESRLLLDGIPDAIIMLDSDGYIKYANPASNTLLGYDTAELNNAPLHLLYSSSEDSIKTEYELGIVRKYGKYVTEAWRIRKGGEKIWTETTLSLLSDDKGGLIGYSCILRDVSARKAGELELRHSEEQYRLLVEGIRDYSIFMLDTTGHIATWNEGAKRMKGYTAEEAIGKHISIFYTPHDVVTNKAQHELDTALATGKYEEEGWRVKKNGSLFWANLILTPLFNEQNVLMGFSKVTRDLTERREYEENLRQSEERNRLLVSGVLDYAIFMLDDKGRIISWNEGAKRIKGYTAEEVIGKYFSIFYPEEDILNGKPPYELKVARSEGKYEEEGWRLRKDGSRFWANVLITAVRNKDGALLGFSKVTRDLTERKEAEKALRESYERYRELNNELKVTNAQLSYANEELEQFTSIVSHDLQEPIRTIKSFLQLIDVKLEKGQYDDLTTYITKSITAANRMKELIQNLLQYSQLSKDEISEEELDVNDLVNQALQNLKTSVDTSNAEIIVEHEVETVRGDRVQLVQLIQNLLSNALKFSEASRPKIIIRSKNENGHVKFSVSDNGIGIPNEDLNKVFEIFRRLNTKRDYPGTGIGLAICKKVVDRHNGRIWPESEYGKGTTFHFTINEDSPSVSA